jgi:NADPH:quinone reductase-like Zn-dependent oxidoreductase
LTGHSVTEDDDVTGEATVTMRAAVVDRYGPPDAVRVVSVPRPSSGEGELLVRVLAAPVTSADARIRGARFPSGFGVPARIGLGITGPRRRILGSSFAGLVERIGAGVDEFRPGDRVCGMTGMRMGTHAEFVVVRADAVAPIPEGVSVEDAAGVLFGGTTALHFLRDRAAVGAGCSVMVNGASGAVGTSAVQSGSAWRASRHPGSTPTSSPPSPTSSRHASLGNPVRR